MSVEVLFAEESGFSVQELGSLVLKVWPEAWQHNAVADLCWEQMVKKHNSYQFAVLVDKKLAAVFRTVPVEFEMDFTNLPAEGWEWAVESSVNLKKPSSVVSAISMSILPEYRGKNLSQLILEKAKVRLAKERNAKTLIAPLRPTLKFKYPLIPMQEYVGWKRADAKAFDPWLRAHIATGARIIGVCERSMYIKGTSQEWSAWTGMEIFAEGDYIVPFALNPVRFAKVNGQLIGVYQEPNVWMVHEL